MARRLFLAIIIALLVCGSLVSCYAIEPATDVKDQEAEAEANTEAETMYGTFIVINKGDIRKSGIYQYIMYDPDTMVMYTYLDGFEGGGPTVMYNADGTPKLYSPSSEIE